MLLFQACQVDLDNNLITKNPPLREGILSDLLG